MNNQSIGGMDGETAYIPLGQPFFRRLRTAQQHHLVSLESQRMAGTVLGFVLLALLAMVFAALTVVCILLRAEWFVIGFFGLALLFCLGFVFSMIRSALAAGRWQPMRLELQEFPLQKGKKQIFLLEQHSKKGLIAWQGGTISARLVCVSVGISKDSRKERSSSYEYRSQWQTQNLPAGSQIKASLELLLPDTLPSSSEAAQNWIEWQLQVRVVLDQKPIPSSSFALLVG
jgi:hypothetical protein